MAYHPNENIKVGATYLSRYLWPRFPHCSIKLFLIIFHFWFNRYWPARWRLGLQRQRPLLNQSIRNQFIDQLHNSNNILAAFTLFYQQLKNPKIISLLISTALVHFLMLLTSVLALTVAGNIATRCNLQVAIVLSFNSLKSTIAHSKFHHILCMT